MLKVFPLSLLFSYYTCIVQQRSHFYKPLPLGLDRMYERFDAASQKGHPHRVHSSSLIELETLDTTNSPSQGDFINVHLIPHTHIDAGWVRTIAEYYEECEWNLFSIIKYFSVLI